MEDDGPMLSIGELARRTGLPVRTIRFWSDIGVVLPAARTGSSRRLYGAACAARLELVAQLDVITDPCIERYWRLTAVINGWPPFPSPIPAFEWLIAALRAHE